MAYVLSRSILLYRFILIIILFSVSAHSQSRFYKRYPGVIANSFSLIEKTPDGGFVTVNSTPYNVKETYITKYTKCGTMEWHLHSNSFAAGNLLITKDNAMLMSSSYNESLKLVKVDLNGNLLWAKSYHPGGNYVYALGEFPNGDLFVNGTAHIYANNQGKGYIMRFDASGNVKWAKEFGDFSSWGFGMACSDGGTLSRTFFHSFKTDSLGTIVWSKVYPNTAQSFPPIEVSDGYVFAKYTYHIKGDTTFLYKTDKSGNPLWTSDRFKLNFATRLRQAANGNFILMGSLKRDSTHRFTPSIVEIDALGNFISQKTFRPVTDSANSFHGDNFCFLNDSSIVISGRDRSVGTGTYLTHSFVAKSDVSRAFGCNDSIISSYFTPPVLSPTNHPVTGTSFTVNTFNQTIVFQSGLPSEETVCSSYEPIPFKFPKNLCVSSNGSLVLHGPPGYEYLWSTGDTTASITVTAAGTYGLQFKHECDNDFSGASAQVKACTEVVSAEEVARETDVYIGPNPTEGHLLIAGFNGQLEIYNSTGMFLLRNQITGPEKLDLSFWEKGMYVITLRSQNSMIIRKILIQ